MLGVPVFLQDGRLLATNGYDADSGYFVHLSGLDEIRTDLSIGDSRRLLLDELLVDFPFVDDASRAHAVALLLEPFVRSLIASPTPLYLLDAPTRGTGKTLLADTVAFVTLGGPASVMALPHDDDEIEKRITSFLLAGTSLVILDNVNSLRSAALAAALTTTEWSGRMLGMSRIVRVRNGATWLATGNNVDLSDELARRIAPIRLDAGVARPEDRVDFRHPDLIAWVRSERPAIVSACVSLVRAWIDAGQPGGAASLGRFEAWARVLGGILDVAGIPGFLSNRARALDEADRDTGDWTALCAAWDERYGEFAVTAKDVLSVARGRQLLLDIWGGRSELGAQQRFGHALARCRDRVFGGYRIVTAPREGETGNAAYRLQPIAVTRNTENTRNTGHGAAPSGVFGVSGVLERPARLAGAERTIRSEVSAPRVLGRLGHEELDV